jgi:hypothetical protein
MNSTRGGLPFLFLGWQLGSLFLAPVVDFGETDMDHEHAIYISSSMTIEL